MQSTKFSTTAHEVKPKAKLSCMLSYRVEALLYLKSRGATLEPNDTRWFI